MTIEQTNKVDGIGIDNEKSELVLLISDHLPWEDEQAHVAFLEGKLGAYLDYLRSGQQLEVVPHAAGMPVRIKLVHEHEPAGSSLRILRAIETQLGDMDIRFSHELLPAGRSRP